MLSADQQNDVGQKGDVTKRMEEKKTTKKKDYKTTQSYAKVKKVGQFVVSQWLSLGFALACLLAHLFPCKHHYLSSIHKVQSTELNVSCSCRGPWWNYQV